MDAFILAQLDAKGLKPTPRADARTLVRRAYSDLIGRPPTPEQVDAFVRDPSQEAWARLIKQLLESPQYDERWGRHWLDVARYADSGGFETDIYYRNAWRYRDYVVKSFNDDKPYSIFVQEQIAGAELATSPPTHPTCPGAPPPYASTNADSCPSTRVAVEVCRRT